MENQERETSRACITINEERETGWPKPTPHHVPPCHGGAPDTGSSLKSQLGHTLVVWLYHPRREKVS